jgi:hypothetical protein
MTRRDLLKQAGFLLAGEAGSAYAQPAQDSAERYRWIHSPRILIAEAYNPPFYPAFDYKPERAIEVAKELNADALRYPSASYYAYFPTKTKYQVHPELTGDPFKRTVELCRDAGLKVVAYVPLNHPFMEVTSKDPNFQNWVKRTKDGTPMTTEHYGYVKYYEGCLNSPVRNEIRELVREVLVNYPVDVMYFDGPYMGMQMARRFCYCEYCQAAYKKARGKAIPDQNANAPSEDEIEFTQWMANDVVIGFLREIREMIRTTRDVPTLYNDTSLLSRREWRNKAIPVVDGFMFEAAETPEQKLFNLQLGRSTGKVIWTYVGTHTQYNREHLKNERVRGWFSYPVESAELLLDGATAVAGGAGLVYWGLSRFFYMPNKPLAYESGRHVKEVFDFAAKHDALLRTLEPRPVAGIAVGSQTIDWYEGRKFVGKAYENHYHGAYQLLKDCGLDAEPFLDYSISAERLAKYKFVILPNTACLSDAQCAAITSYVNNGGWLFASAQTSVADEFGRMRKNFGLAETFGVSFESAEPVEIPDLYWKLPDGELIPQDPQTMIVKAAPGTMVVATTWDVGHRKDLGPSAVMRRVGKGRCYYFNGSYEAIYEETRLKVLRGTFLRALGRYFDGLRTYDVEYRPGLMPHLTASDRTLLLHMLANTGNKVIHLRSREEFLPVDNVKVGIRLPHGKKAQSISLLRSGQMLTPESSTGEDWVRVTVPRVLIHEAVRVDLS